MNVTAFFRKIDAMEASIVERCQQTLDPAVLDACELVMEGGIPSFVHDLIEPLKAGYEHYLHSLRSIGPSRQEDLLEFQETVNGAIDSILAIIIYEETGDELVDNARSIEQFLHSLKALMKEVIGEDPAMAMVYTTS